jgi:hypothetical protein
MVGGAVVASIAFVPPTIATELHRPLEPPVPELDEAWLALPPTPALVCVVLLLHAAPMTSAPPKKAEKIRIRGLL